jgi:hypothetical protein
MVRESGDGSLNARAAGDYVEVVDATSRAHHKVGRVAFFVADNIYVTFRGAYRSSTKMFFPDQLRPAAAPQEEARPARPSTLLGTLRTVLRNLRP